MYRIDGSSDLAEEVLTNFEGYLGSAPGADRQRRRRPAPARHLRRADRLRLPLQQARDADLARCLDRSVADRRVGVRELGPGGRGDLGGPRRPPALHLLPPDVLGRGRARGPDRPPARAAGRPRSLDGDPRRDLPPGDRAAAGIRAARRLRPALRHRRPRRLGAADAADEVHGADRSAAGSRRST